MLLNDSPNCINYLLLLSKSKTAFKRAIALLLKSLPQFLCDPIILLSNENFICNIRVKICIDVYLRVYIIDVEFNYTIVKLILPLEYLRF